MKRLKFLPLAVLCLMGATFFGLFGFAHLARVPWVWLLKSTSPDTVSGLVAASLSVLFIIFAGVFCRILISEQSYLKYKEFSSKLKSATKAPVPITQAVSSRKEPPNLESQRAHEVGQNDPEGGLRILDELLSREPAAIGAYNVYGQLSMKRGDLVTARDAFESHIKASPDDDHRYDWAYLALIIGLQGDEAKARECAGRTDIKIQYEFADSVRRAYLLWLRVKGSTASRLPRTRK